jgi:TRAP-type C4-dicarboxylate transport system permease small subunit
MADFAPYRGGLRNVCDAAFAANTLVTGAAFIALCCCVIIQVISRYVFHHSFAWAEELPIFLFVWTCFLAAAAAYREGRHLGVTLIYDRLPGSFKNCVDYLVIFITMAFFAVVFVVEGNVTLNIYNTFVVMNFSKKWQYIGIPISCGLFLLYALEKCILKSKGDPLWNTGGTR